MLGNAASFCVDVAVADENLQRMIKSTLKEWRSFTKKLTFLRIVKELRIAKLAARTLMTPEQEMIIKWFDEYKLETDESDH